MAGGVVMARSYVITLRMDVDERADHPKNWDWATLLDLPNSGGVEVLSALPLDSEGSAEVNYATAGFRSNK
jgi:hypothetical protein